MVFLLRFFLKKKRWGIDNQYDQLGFFVNHSFLLQYLHYAECLWWWEPEVIG